MSSTQKLIERLEQILPGLQNSNSQAEVAMVEALPEVIARLRVMTGFIKDVKQRLATSEIHGAKDRREAERMKAESDMMAEALKVTRPYALLGLDVAQDWPDIGEIDGFDLFDMLRNSGVIKKHPEPYDPDKHPPCEECEPGKDWYVSAASEKNARKALERT